MRIWRFFRNLLVKLGLLKKSPYDDDNPPDDLYPLW